MEDASSRITFQNATMMLEIVEVYVMIIHTLNYLTRNSLFEINNFYLFHYLFGLFIFEIPT